MNITAKELSGNHLFQTISVPVERAFIIGELEDFEWITETETITNFLGEELKRTVVNKELCLSVGGYRIRIHNENTPITIQEGQ